MRLLPDERLPKRLRRLLAPHDVQAVQQAGWSGVQDGALLVRAAESFDDFVTVDQCIRHQQNLAGLTFGRVDLVARSNNVDDLQPLIPKFPSTLEGAMPGSVIRDAAFPNAADG